MRYKLKSDTEADAAWLIWGRNKIRSLKSAGVNTFVKRFVMDPSGDLIVEIASRGETDTGAVTVIRLALRNYFGHGAKIPMRCFCRNIGLYETTSPTASVTLTEENRVNLGYVVGYMNYTSEIVARVNGIEVGRVSSSYTSSGGTADDHSAPVRRSINVVSSASNSIGPRPTPYALLSQDPSFTSPGEDIFGDPIWTLSSWNESWSTPFDAAIAAAKDAIFADADARIAVVLSDGEELVSELQRFADNEDGSTNETVLEPTWASMQWPGGSNAVYFDYDADNADVYIPTGVLNFTVPDDACYTKLELPPYPGGGGANAPTLFYFIEDTEPGEPANVGVRIDQDGDPLQYINTGTYLDGIYTNMPINVGTALYPDYLVTLASYDGTTYSETTQSFSAEVEAATFFTDSISDFATETAAWGSYWTAGQVAGRAREINRRLKCSKARHTLLRSGFLPPEFEEFIKKEHPKSILLRRKYPMQVINRTYTLLSDVIEDDPEPAAFLRTRMYSGSVTLSYDLEVEGEIETRQETFEGMLTLVETTHVVPDSFLQADSKMYTFENFPLLSDANTGQAFPISGVAGLPVISNESEILYDAQSLLYQDGTNGTLQDLLTALGVATLEQLYALAGVTTEAEFLAIVGFPSMQALIDVFAGSEPPRPLMVIANGVMYDSPWYTTDKFDLASYTPEYNLIVPEIFPAYNDVDLTHPDLLKTYHVVSEPIAKNADGTDVTPNVNWLTSRLVDGEIIKVVPLEYISASGENFGMHPILDPNSVDIAAPTTISRVRINGYAEFKYIDATSSFSFVRWVEFVEDGTVSIAYTDEVEVDDELNPTTMTVTNGSETATYNLAPRHLPYSDRYDYANCVCITNKAKWSDVKAAAATQKAHISTTLDPESPEFPELTDDEYLYYEVSKALFSSGA
jgi:hypothetical protein